LKINLLINSTNNCTKSGNMKYQDKTVEELIVLLEELQKENKIFAHETVKHKLTEAKLKESEEKLHNLFEHSTAGQSITSIMDNASRKQAEQTLRKSEERFHGIFNNLQDAFFQVDLSGNISLVNPAAVTIFGYHSAEEMVGKPAAMLYADIEDRTRLLNEMSENGSVADYLIVGKKQDGTTFWTSMNVQFKYENGQISCTEGLVRDITEKKQMLNDLIKAKEKAEESDRLKSAFLANMSHEIRTPMNGILGFIELLKEPNLSGKDQKAYIQVIEESGDRMLNLMNNLIDISRIESGETKVQISSFNIKKQLDNVYKFFVHEANRKGLKLICNFKISPNNTVIESDMQKLDAILINLVKNAIKFTRQGTVEFGCTRQGNNFRFFVKDSGVGIDSGYQQIIFDRFRQANESLSRPYEGAGLGLSISRAFIDALGGKIWVESEVGKGSTFYFILPANIKEKDEYPVQRAFETNKTKILKEEFTVLIVEDDDTSMDYLEIVAGTFCRKLLKARTGNEAVEIFYANQDVNLILMDIKLDGMDGFEATRQIRQFNKEVVIIAQTAYSMIGDKEKALEAGCNDYISKPINKDELMDLIRLHAKGK